MMHATEMIPDKFYKSTTERIKIPGNVSLFVTVIEDDNGKPFKIAVNGPKSGTPVASWCNALVEAVNIALTSGVDLMKFIEAFSNIAESKAIRLISGVTARSGPEGVAIALMRYRDGKEIERNYDEEDYDDDEDNRPRWLNPPI